MKRTLLSLLAGLVLGAGSMTTLTPAEVRQDSLVLATSSCIATFDAAGLSLEQIRAGERPIDADDVSERVAD